MSGSLKSLDITGIKVTENSRHTEQEEREGHTEEEEGEGHTDIVRLFITDLK